MPADDAILPSDRAAAAPTVGRRAEEERRLRSACRDLEALFIQQLLSAMRRTVPKSGLIDGGRAEEIATSMLDAELSKSMAGAGGLGLAEVLERELSRAAAGGRGGSPGGEERQGPGPSGRGGARR